MFPIGFDFGNSRMHCCFFSDTDPVTGLGGTAHYLTPAEYPYGIPSIYFYSAADGELIGGQAVRRGRPKANQLGCLKRHIGQKVVLDEKEISYDAAITKLIEHGVRLANKEMMAGFQENSNQIYLSYPASYTNAQLKHLIHLAEQATLDNGDHVVVAGTIAEPAAAGLDFLAEYIKRPTTIMVTDIGGGTTDFSLLYADPIIKGEENEKKTRYDILCSQGIPNLGGNEFDEIVFQLLVKKVKRELSQIQREKLRIEAEEIKISLSEDDIAATEVYLGDDNILIEITREEFEEAAKPLLDKIVCHVRNILEEHKNQQPEYVVLTGGSSQMPVISKTLEQAFPEYRGKIKLHRPKSAIALGTARYGAIERIPDVATEIVKRTSFDIGIRFLDKSESSYIDTLIPAGSRIPFETEWGKSWSFYDLAPTSQFRVYEANKRKPDRYEIERDYNEILSVTIEYPEPVPKGYCSLSRLIIDDNCEITVEVRDMEKDGSPVLKNHIKLMNIQGGICHESEKTGD